MRVFPLTSRACVLLCLCCVVPAFVASQPTPPSAVPSSFTCVSSGDQGGSCFVASCAQLRAAVQAGVSHVTLYRNLSAADDDQCQFPLVVSKPLTVRGACGDGRARCAVFGGGRLVRKDLNTCRQKCTTCVGGTGPLFDVRPGGHLTLTNLELKGGCNAKDGAGGAVVVRGKRESGQNENTEQNCQDKPTTSEDVNRLVSWADADEAAKVVTDLRAERMDVLVNGPMATTGVNGNPPDQNSNKQPSASLVAVGVFFSQNLVTGGGGDGYFQSTTGQQTRSPPWNGKGGAVAVLDTQAAAEFVDCEFTGNEAWGSASADFGNAYVSDVGEGGAVFVDGGSLFVARSKFVGNVGEKEGGAVFATGGATIDITATTFTNNTVTDDYWDGGGAVFLGGVGTTATVDVARFVGNSVTEYPDQRRRALTCGGGAVAVTTGAAVSFRYTLFEKNAAPRGGAVCVHDATARFDPGGATGTGVAAMSSTAVFRNNAGKHAWFDQPPGNDVECVQCFTSAQIGGGATQGQTSQVTTTPSKCAYTRDAAATRMTAVGQNGATYPACAPPPDAFSFSMTNYPGNGAVDARDVPGLPPKLPPSNTGTPSGVVAAAASSGSNGGTNALEAAFAAAFTNGDRDDDAVFVNAAGESGADANAALKRATRSEGSF